MPPSIATHVVDTPADAARLRDWLLAAHGPAAAQRLDRQTQLPRYRSGFTMLAQQGNVIVGAALLRHERRRLGAATLEAGMAALFCAEAGAETVREALIGAAAGVLAEHGVPLMLLHAAAAQWQPFGMAPVALRSRTALPPAEASAPVDLRWNAPLGEDDLADVAALHDANHAALPLSIVRTAPDWRAWPDETPTRALLYDRLGRASAYAAVERSAGAAVWHVTEAAAADAGVARTLLGALGQHAAQHAMRLVLDLAFFHPVHAAALAMGGSTELRAARAEEPALLAGVVDGALLIAALLPAFAERLVRSRYAGWSGTVRIETEAERVTLLVADGAPSVTDDRAADIRLRNVSLLALAQLCLGYRVAADLRATGALHCDDAALGLIDTLFPLAYAG